MKLQRIELRNPLVEIHSTLLSESTYSLELQDGMVHVKGGKLGYRIFPATAIRQMIVTEHETPRVRPPGLTSPAAAEMLVEGVVEGAAAGAMFQTVGVAPTKKRGKARKRK